MSLTSEEPNADHESSNEHHFFIKEDAKEQRSDEEEEEEDAESKDENENKPDLAHANVFAALAALQTGQLTLSQVSYPSSYIIVRWEGSTISHMNCLHSAFNSIQFPAIADQMSRNKTEIKYTESRWNFQSNVHN